MSLAVVLLGLGALFFGYIRPHWMVYGTVRLQVNPDVQLSVSREEDVTFNITIQVTEDLEQSRTITYDHDSEMWRGRLNRLGFELAQQSGQ